MQHFLAHQQQQQQQYGDWPAQAQAHHQQSQHHVGQHGQHYYDFEDQGFVFFLIFFFS
jgi:hypothetical protein